MKLVFISLLKGRFWGGSENLWYNTALLALKQKQQVLIVIDKHLNPIKVELLKEKGAQIFYLENHLYTLKDKFINLLDSNYANKKFYKNLEKTVQRFKPNLIIVNQPGCYDIAFDNIVYNFLKNTSTKFVLTFHSYVLENVLNEEKSVFMNQLMQKAKGNYFVAKKQAQTIINQLKINLSNLFYIQNPLNVDTTALIEYPNDDILQMASVGSLDIQWKGQDILLNIFSKSYWLVREWHLNIYGDGPDFERLKTLIRQLNLQDRVTLMGHQNDIKDIWRKHHLLLMPSRIDAAPSVLLEAMASTRTVVCTNIGFVEDWIEDGKTGFVSELNNINSYESKLNEMWENKANLKKMGIKARAFFKQKQTKEVEQLFLKQLLKNINEQ